MLQLLNLVSVLLVVLYVCCKKVNKLVQLLQDQLSQEGSYT